MRLINLTK
jgi:ABC-type multidrug transport system ATPase subunit